MADLALRITFNGVNQASNTINDIRRELTGLGGTATRTGKILKGLSVPDINSSAFSDIIKDLKEIKEETKDVSIAMGEPLKGFRTEVKEIKEEFTDFLTNAAAGMTGLANPTMAFASALSRITDDLPTKILGSFFDELRTQTDRALQDTAKLSDVFRGIGDVAFPSITGALGFGTTNNAALQEGITEALKLTLQSGLEGAFKGIDFEAFGKNIKFDGFNKLIESIPLFGIGQQFGKVDFQSFDKITKQALDFIDFGALGKNANAVNKLLGGFGARVLPELLSGKINGAVGAYFDFVEVTLGKTLEKVVSNAVTNGLKPSFDRKKAVQALDKFSGGKITENIYNKLAPDIAQRMVNVAGLERLFPTFISNISELIPGLIANVPTINLLDSIAPGLGSLFATAGDDFIYKGAMKLPGAELLANLGKMFANEKLPEDKEAIDKLKKYEKFRSDDFLGKIAGGIADFAYLSSPKTSGELIGGIFDSIINTKGAFEQSIINSFDNTLGSLLDGVSDLGSIIPPEVRTAIEATVNALPEETRTAVTSLFKDIKTLGQRLIQKFISKSANDSLIDSLTKQLEGGRFDAVGSTNKLLDVRKQLDKNKTLTKLNEANKRIFNQQIDQVTRSSQNIVEGLLGIYDSYTPDALGIDVDSAIKDAEKTKRSEAKNRLDERTRNKVDTEANKIRQQLESIVARPDFKIENLEEIQKSITNDILTNIADNIGLQVGQSETGDVADDFVQSLLGSILGGIGGTGNDNIISSITEKIFNNLPSQVAPKAKKPVKPERLKSDEGYDYVTDMFGQQEVVKPVDYNQVVQETRDKLRTDLLSSFNTQIQAEINSLIKVRDSGGDVTSLLDASIDKITNNLVSSLPQNAQNIRETRGTILYAVRNALTTAMSRVFEYKNWDGQIALLDKERANLESEIERLQGNLTEINEVGLDEADRRRQEMKLKLAEVKRLDRQQRVNKAQLDEYRELLLGDQFMRKDVKEQYNAQIKKDDRLSGDELSKLEKAVGKAQLSGKQQGQILRQYGKGFEDEELIEALATRLEKGDFNQDGSRTLRDDQLSTLQKASSSGKLNQGALGALLKRFRGGELDVEEKQQINQRINQRILEEAKGSGLESEVFLLRVQRVVDDLPEILKGLNIVESLETLEKSTNGALSKIFMQLGNTAAESIVKGLAGGLAESVYPIVDAVDGALVQSYRMIEDLPKRYTQPIEFLGNATSGLTEAIEPFSHYKKVLGGFLQYGQQLMAMGQSLFFLQEGFTIVSQIAINNPLTNALKRGAEFEQQLIKIRSGLVATNQIATASQGALNGAGAFAAIAKPVEASIEQLRQRSLELANFTGDQLVEPFSIVSGFMGQIGGDLTDAVDLTVSFAAGMSSIGLPAQQAAQEIRSIVMGDITPDSILARTLQLTNAQVNTWRTQGTLITELQKRLQPFVAGQEEAAKGITGLISNIQDFYLETSRIATKPLLETVRGELIRVYEGLRNSQKAFSDFGALAVNEINRILKALFSIGEAFLSIFKDTGSDIALFSLQSIANIIEIVAQSIKNTIQILEPFITAFGALAKSAVSMGGPLLTLAIQFKAMQFGVSGLFGGFNLLTRVLPGVGGLISFVGLRSLPLINTFTNLTKTIGFNSAAFLTFGQNLNKIPGLAGQVQGLLKFLGPLAPTITAIIPGISTLLVKGSGLAAVLGKFGGGALFGNLLKSLPEVVRGMGALAGNKLVSGNAKFGKEIKNGINDTTEMLAKYVEQMLAADNKTNAFSKTANALFSSFKDWAIQTALLTGGMYAAFKIFNAITQNQELMNVIKGTVQGFKELAVATKEFLTTGISGFIIQVSAVFGGLIFVLVRSAIVSAYMGKVFSAMALSVSANVASMVGGLERFAYFIKGFPVFGEFFATQATKMKESADIIQGAYADKSALKDAQKAFDSDKSFDNFVQLEEAQKKAAASGKGAMAAVGGFASSLVMLIGPMVAVAAAIAAVSFAWNAWITMPRANNRLDEMMDTSQASDKTYSLYQQLIEAQKLTAERTKQGIRLTEEEYKKNQRLAAYFNSDIENKKSKLEELRGMLAKEGNSDIANRIKTQILDVETEIKRFEGALANIAIAPKELPKLGDYLEQISKNAEIAWNAMTNPSGDPEIFKKQLDTITDLNTTLFEFGEIDASTAISKLSKVASTEVEGTTEQISKAQKAIVQILEQDSERRINIIQREQSEVDALRQQGKLGEFKAEQETTDLKVKELEERKRAQREIQSQQTEFGNIEAAKKAGEEIKKIDADIAKANAEALKKRNAELIKNFEEQQSIIEGYLAQGMGTEERFNTQKNRLQVQGLDEQLRQQRQSLNKLGSDDKEGREAVNAEIGKLQTQRQKIIKEGYDAELATLEKQLQKTVDLVKEAELERQVASQRKFNEKGGDENLINEEEVKGKLKDIEAEYKKTVETLNKMKAQPALSDPRLEAERQAEIRKLRQQSLQQTLELLKTEKEAWDAQTEVILGNIERENNARLLGIERQINAGNKVRELGEAQAATDTVKNLQKQISREKEANKLSQLKLDLERAIGDEREAWLNFNVTNAEVESTRELNTLTQSYLDNKITKEGIALEQAKNNLDIINLQIAGTNDRQKSVELEKERLEAIQAIQDAEKNLALSTNKSQNIEELNELTNQYLDNRIIKEEVAVQKAKNNLEQIDTEIAYTKDRNTLLELQQRRLEAIQEIKEAEKSSAIAKIEIQNLKELNQASRDYLTGRISQNELAVQQAKDNLEVIEAEAKITSDRKGQLEVEKKRIEAVRALRDAEKTKRLADIEAINNIELIGLKKLLNRGRILREEYDLTVAKHTIKNIEQRLALETDSNEKIKLQLELVEAQGALIDANVKKYEAGLNKESQRYENTIKRQNAELNKQTRQYEALTKALQMRSDLQQAQRSVFDAANNFYQGELDALVQGEKSEAKKKQLAELIAAIKLRSAVEQAKFEQQSLIMQQQMKAIELEREEIAKRSALNQAKLDAKRAESALKVAQFDPRTTPEQLEALRLEVELSKENITYQEDDLKLIQAQKEKQAEIFKLQQEQMDYQNKSTIRSAQVELANNTANRSLQRQRRNDIAQDVLKSFGANNIRDLTSKASATGEEALRYSGLGRGQRQINPISAEEQMRTLRGDSGDFSSAVGRVGDEIYRMTGNLTQPTVSPLPQSREPLKLPAGLTPTIAPSITQDFSRALQQAGMGKSAPTTISPTINIPITVNGDAKVGESIKKQVEPRLENVINQMVNISRS